MKIKPKSFRIPFPIKIFKNRKINFSDKNQREKLFRRNIYYYLYGNKKNFILEKRWRLFLDLAFKIKEYLNKEKGNIDVLSISIFGSALHSKINDDYDFLVIVNGNRFDNIKTKIKLKNKNYSVGISIKGLENFQKGVVDKRSHFDKEFQRKIIYRTSISLPYRHLSVLGLDFKENKDIFLVNCYAQIYNLLINTYKRYYIVNLKNNISNKVRARKILSRIFEASKYASLISQSEEIERFQRRIVLYKSNKNYTLNKSKDFFRRFVRYYHIFI